MHERHPAVVAVLRFFESDHLPEGPIKAEALRFAHFAYAMADDYAGLNDPELTWALRKLLESKDAAMRCAVVEEKAARGVETIVNPSELAVQHSTHAIGPAESGEEQP